MKLPRPSAVSILAFTLVEMLVVIAIVGVLAGMLLTAGNQMTRSARIKQSQAQMTQIVLWVESYKAKRGQYPPDNPANATLPTNSAYSALPPLVYELTGSQFDRASDQYQSPRSNAPIPRLSVKAVFGIDGLANTTLPGSGDDAPKAENFVRNMDPKNVAAATTYGLEILISQYERPTGPAYPPVFDPSGSKALNPWNYVVTNPQHNKTSFDLWIDLQIGNRIYRICNWSQKPIVLP